MTGDESGVESLDLDGLGVFCTDLVGECCNDGGRREFPHDCDDEDFRSVVPLSSVRLSFSNFPEIILKINDNNNKYKTYNKYNIAAFKQFF